MTYRDMQRLAIMPRMAVNYYEPPTPAYWDLSKLNKKWYWRGLHWLLKKLGAQYQESTPESIRVDERTIDNRNVQALIATSTRAMRALWDKKATTLIVGHDEMNKIIRDAPREYLTFDTQIRLGCDREIRYMGIRVVCVPWLEGWALLPDLDK